MESLIPRQSAGGTHPDLNALLIYCRAGFEKEAAAEISEHAEECRLTGYIKAKLDSGFILYVITGRPAEHDERFPRLDKLTFARQLVHVSAAPIALSPADRIRPLMERTLDLSERVSDAFLEYADTNEGRELTGFIRKFTSPFTAALERGGVLRQAKAPRLHVFFLSSVAAYVGLSDPGNGAPWPLGIPRLKYFREAPSRSALKLEEAFLTLLSIPDQELRPGMTAVDLGAAPGGWTWQLIRRHLRVTSVDNGNLAPALLESGMVTHLRVDGFRFRPAKPVDWLVCDIVEQPYRIAELVAEWFANRYCRSAIFNLKLPMKKRYEELQRCRHIIDERLSEHALPFALRFKQLYHDRAEVTGYLRVLNQ